MQLSLCQARPSAAPRAWLPLHGPCSVAAFRRQHPAGARRPGGPAATARQLAVVAAASASAQPGSGSSDATADCPLHACLQEFGLADLAPFSGRSYLAMPQAAVDAEVRPKLADLAAEGLRPGDLAALLAKPAFPLMRGYVDVFRPNIALLRNILTHCNKVPHPGQAHLSAVGQRLVGGAAEGARVLGRDPGKIAQLLGWAERELGVSRAELSQSSSIFLLLSTSRSAAEAVHLLASDFGFGREAVAGMFLACPQLFRLKPGPLSGKVSVLQQELHISLARAAGLCASLAQLFPCFPRPRKLQRGELQLGQTQVPPRWPGASTLSSEGQRNAAL